MAPSPRLRVLAVAMVAPLMLAGIRLNGEGTLQVNTTDAPSGFAPAAQSQILPSAGVLATPTLILVSPSILPGQPSPSTAPSATTAPGTAPVQVIRVITVNPNAMPKVSAELCGRAMGLVSQLTLLSYQQKRNKKVMTLNAAATLATAQAAAGVWPQMAGFNSAVANLPWRFPQKDDILTAVKAARALCLNPNGGEQSPPPANVDWPSN